MRVQNEVNYIVAISEVGLMNMVTIRLHTGREIVWLHALSIVSEDVVPYSLTSQYTAPAVDISVSINTWSV